MFLFHLSFTVKKCGSLNFHVVLKFTTDVAEDDTISIIQNAIVDGKIGELSVNASCIIGIPRFPQTTVPLKGKLTGSTQSSKLDSCVVKVETFEFRDARIESRASMPRYKVRWFVRSVYR